MGICIYWLSRHVILQIKNHTQLTRTVGNISQSDLYMLADLVSGSMGLFSCYKRGTASHCWLQTTIDDGGRSRMLNFKRGSPIGCNWPSGWCQVFWILVELTFHIFVLVGCYAL